MKALRPRARTGLGPLLRACLVPWRAADALQTFLAALPWRARQLRRLHKNVATHHHRAANETWISARRGLRVLPDRGVRQSQLHGTKSGAILGASVAKRRLRRRDQSGATTLRPSTQVLERKPQMAQDGHRTGRRAAYGALGSSLNVRSELCYKGSSSEATGDAHGALARGALSSGLL